MIEKEFLFSPEEKKEKSFWEEKERSIFENLEKKVNVVKELRRLVDETKIEENPEIVKERFNKYKEEVFNRFPEAAEAIKKRKEIKKEREEIIKKLNSIEKRLRSRKLSEEERLKLEKEKSRLTKKNLKLIKILETSSPDVDFLESIERGTASLIEKFLSVHKIKKKEIPEILKKVTIVTKNLKETLEISRLPSDKVKNVIFTPFNANLVLEKEFFEKLFGKNRQGFTLRGIIFNIIKEKKDKDELNKAIEHENIHQLLEGFLPPTADYPFSFFIKDLRERFVRINKWKEIGAPKNVIETDKYILKRRALKALDIFRNEILADISSIEQSLRKPLYKENDIAGILKGVGRYRDVGFTTSAVQLDEIETLIRTNIEKQEADPEMKKFYSLILERISKTFEKTVSSMREALFISRYLKDPLEVHSLLFLLKPSKFYHIEKYLRYKYGDEFYEGLSGLYRFLSEKDLSLKTIKGINKMKDNLPASEREFFKGELKNIIETCNTLYFFDKAKLEKSSIEELREYFSLIEALGPWLNVEKDKIKIFSEDVFEIFFLSLLHESLKSNFKTLGDIFNKLTLKEKEIFKKALENYFKEGLIYRDLEKEGEETPEFVKSLPFWQKLKELNLDQIAEKGLQGYRESFEKGF